MATTAPKAERDIVELIVAELRRRRAQLAQIQNGQIIIHIAQGQPEPVKLEAHYRLN